MRLAMAIIAVAFGLALMAVEYWLIEGEQGFVGVIGFFVTLWGCAAWAIEFNRLGKPKPKEIIINAVLEKDEEKQDGKKTP
jgi:hypothetical protein